MLDQVKRIFRDSTIYGLGNLLPKAAAFVLIPVYTRYLTPADYGILSLAMMVASMAAVVLVMGQNGSLTLYFRSASLEHDEEDAPRRLLFSVVLFVLLFGALFMALSFVFGDSVTSLVISSPDLTYHPYISIALWIAYLGTPLVLLQAVNRARGQAGTHTVLQLGNFGLNTAATLYLVVVLQQGALGSMRGTLIATVVLVPISLFLLGREMRFRFSWAWLKRSLSFGTPLVPHYFAGWLLTFSDRYLLERFSTLQSVGLYSLAYNISMALNVLTASINQAWGPIYYDLADSEDGRQILPRLTTIYAAAVTTIGVAFVLISRELLLLLSARQYWDAAPIVPIVGAGYWAFGMYSVLSTSIFYLKRTRLIPSISFVAATLNIGLNIVLIPLYGIHAAAWTTVAAYSLMAILAALMSSRLMPGMFERGKLLTMTVLFVLTVTATLFLDASGLTLSVSVPLKFVLFLVVVALHVLLVIRVHEIRELTQRIPLLRAARKSKEYEMELEAALAETEGHLTDDTGFKR